jgi:hypothetical protein
VPAAGLHRPPALPRDNPLECPVTGKQLSTRIDGGLDRACPHAA